MANEPYVVFSQRAFNSIVTETIHKNPVETGGILIGYVLDNGVRIVVENIPPGQNSQHKWGYFEYDLKSATKLFSVLLASKRPLITELADKLRLKYPLLPTISPCPTMRLEAIRSIIPISCRRYPKSV